MFEWSAAEIHLPQLLNEEAIADEFSRWEQVSSVAAERFAHRFLPPPALSQLLPVLHGPRCLLVQHCVNTSEVSA